VPNYAEEDAKAIAPHGLLQIPDEFAADVETLRRDMERLDRIAGRASSRRGLAADAELKKAKEPTSFAGRLEQDAKDVVDGVVGVAKKGWWAP